MTAICQGQLRKDTAASIVIGPLVDSVDGKTPVTTLDINDVNCFVFKNAVKTTKTLSTANFTASSNGYWILSLDATDTNTAGNMKIVLQTDVILPYCEKETVMPADNYDAFFGENTLMSYIQTIISSFTTTIMKTERMLEYNY